ncbi:hypothetical protein AAG906_014793 [Vitis piasezkii]
MSPIECFSLSTHIPLFQFVTSLPHSSKGWAKGHVLVSGPWSESTEGPNKLFTPQRSLEIPIEWVEKSYFTCLNKLFEIDQAERSQFVLLKEKNLKVVLKHLKPFMIPVFSQLRPSILVPNEHFVLKTCHSRRLLRLWTLRHDKLVWTRVRKTSRRDFAPSSTFSYLASNSALG